MEGLILAHKETPVWDKNWSKDKRKPKRFEIDTTESDKEKKKREKDSSRRRSKRKRDDYYYDDDYE